MDQWRARAHRQQIFMKHTDAKLPKRDVWISEGGTVVAEKSEETMMSENTKHGVSKSKLHHTQSMNAILNEHANGIVQSGLRCHTQESVDRNAAALFDHAPVTNSMRRQC